MAAFITLSNRHSVNLDRIAHIRDMGNGTSELEDDCGVHYLVALPASVVVKVLASHGVRIVDLDEEARKNAPPERLKKVS